MTIKACESHVWPAIECCLDVHHATTSRTLEPFPAWSSMKTVTCSLLMTGISINQWGPVDKGDQFLSLVWMQETDVAFRRFGDVSWTCEGFCQLFFGLWIFSSSLVSTCVTVAILFEHSIFVSTILLAPSTYELTLLESCQFACERLIFVHFSVHPLSLSFFHVLSLLKLLSLGIFPESSKISFSILGVLPMRCLFNYQLQYLVGWSHYRCRCNYLSYLSGIVMSLLPQWNNQRPSPSDRL